MLDVQASPDTVDDDQQAGHHGGDQSSNCDPPEVLGSPEPSERNEESRHDQHPDTERELQGGGDSQGPDQLGDEDDEDTTSSVQGQADRDHGDDPAPGPHSLLTNGGVGVPHLTSELLIPLLQHDPAETQPGPGVQSVDCEENDQHCSEYSS